MTTEAITMTIKKIFVILAIAMSSELQPTDMVSRIGTTILLLQH